MGETENEKQRGTPSEREQVGEGVSVGLGGVRGRRRRAGAVWGGDDGAGGGNGDCGAVVGRREEETARESRARTEGGEQGSTSRGDGGGRAL